MKRSPVWYILLSILTLSVLSPLPSSAAAAPSHPPLSVYIAADPHYIAPELTDNGTGFTRLVEAADGKDMLRCERIMDAFLSQVIRDHPDALILPGDLSFNGAEASLRQLAEKLSEVRKAGIPVFVIPGNHDLDCPMAAKFTGETYTLVPSVSVAEFVDLYEEYGFREALSRDSASLSYTAQLSPEFRLLMLDVNGNEKPGTVSEATLFWVEQQLQRAKTDGVSVIAVSHQTLLSHSFLASGVAIRNAEPLLSLYEQYDVLCNLSGHMHIQHILISENGFPDISGSALITWPNQFGVLTLDNHMVSYRTERTETGVEAESEQFLRDTALRQAFTELQALKLKSDLPSMADYFARVNMAYISGQLEQINWEDPSYQDWQAQQSIVAYYLQSIRNDPITDHTRFNIPIH